MKGTVKQVKWAEDIKATCLNTIELNKNYHINRIEENKDGKNTWVLAKESELYVKAWNHIEGLVEKAFEEKDEAKWYIENKDLLTLKLTEWAKEKVEEYEKEEKKNKEEHNMEKKDVREKTVKELREEAKKAGIKGASRMKKEDLIKALMGNGKVKVYMYAFTGMYIGEFEADVTEDGMVVDTKLKGELLFNNDGIEVTSPEKARWANKIVKK